MKSPLICICGNTGSGKSTLTKLIATALGCLPLVEVAQGNPYLDDYLLDPSQWGFHVQLHYLVRHLKDSPLIRESKITIIRDRSFYEGAEIYAKELLTSGRMSRRDYDLYQSLYELLLPNLPIPDALIYLCGDPETLLSRISRRSRQNEDRITKARLETTCQLYDAWIRDFVTCPVIKVTIADRDFLHRPAEISFLLSELKRVLPDIDFPCIGAETPNGQTE